METGRANYKQLAEEIGEVLQAAAEKAEKMLEEARADAARIRGDAERDRRSAYAEGRRILDEARMEADMVRAEAEWQAQEIIARARRQAAERIAGADSRLADLAQVENRVMDRLAGVGQVLADALATLREGPSTPVPSGTPIEVPAVPQEDPDRPSAKVYFVEFPPAAPARPISGHAPAAAEASGDGPDTEIVLTDGSGPFAAADEHSEWAPPSDLPAWWTRDGAQG